MEKQTIERVSGFVAGTLVHTIDGLKPIEQIQVGDLVLSKPEDGNGELAYKHVVRTHTSENKTAIYHIRCSCNPSPFFKENQLPAYLFDNFVRWSLFCSGEHPFWSVEYLPKNSASFIPQHKWVEASSMFFEHVLMDKDGRHYLTSCASPDDKWRHELEPLYITSLLKVAVGLYNSEMGIDFQVDFSNDSPMIINGGGAGGFDDDVVRRYGPQKVLSVPLCKEDEKYRYYHDINSAQSVNYEDPYYYDDVYSIKVTDYHTYFVGHVGIWVHQ